MRGLQHRVIGDKSALTIAAVFGGDIDIAQRLEKLQLEQVGLGASAKKERGTAAHLLYLGSEIEQRGHTHAAANQKQTLVGSVGHGEAIAQRKDTVEGIADMELAHLAGTVANTGDKEPKFVGLGIKIVNGYRTTQKSIGRLFYLHLDKLTRRHRRHGVLRSQLDEYVLLVEVVDGTYGQVQASLLHK